MHILTLSSFKHFTFCSLKLRFDTKHTSRTASEHCKLCFSVSISQRFELSHMIIGFHYLSSDVDKIFDTSWIMTC